MARAHLTVGAFLVVFAAAPMPTHAQPDAFAQAVRDLAAASTRAEPARSTDLHAAATRMTRALANWDRALEAFAQRTEAELPQASSDRQAQMHVDLGLAFRARGRLTDALREFDAAVRLQLQPPPVQALQPGTEPSSLNRRHRLASAHLLRALTLEATGDDEGAKRAFRAAWHADPDAPAATYFALQRRALADSGERAAAVAALTHEYERLSTEHQPPATPPFVVADGLPDTLITTPIVGDSQTADAFRLLSIGRYDEGLAALTRASAMPSDAAPRTHFSRAKALEAEGRVAAARKEYEASVPGALTSRSTIHVAIGRLAQVEGDTAGATAAFTQAVRLNPNEPLVHRELASALAAQGRVDDGFAELVAALMINPADSAVHAAIGQLLLDADRPADAVRAFTRALQLNAAGWEVRYALVAALTRLGRRDEAARELATFEHDRRLMLERRRQGIQQEVEKEEAIRSDLQRQGSTP